jgi:hypothetical protein
LELFAVNAAGQDALLVAAETGEPVAFAQALVSARQPTVLVLPSRLANGTREVMRQPSVIGPASRLIDAFNGKQRRFNAELVAGVVQIREVALPAAITRVLEQKHDVSFDGIAVGASMSKIASLISPIGHPPGAGIVGSGLPPPPSCPLGTTVRVSMAGVSLGGVLNEIVRQEPGIAWALTYDSNPAPTKLSLEILCPDGYTRTMAIRDWSPRSK